MNFLTIFIIILILSFFDHYTPLFCSSSNLKSNNLHICKNCKHFRIINKTYKNKHDNIEIVPLEICKLGLDIFSKPGIIQYKTTHYMRNNNDPNYSCGFEGKYFKPKL